MPLPAPDGTGLEHMATELEQLRTLLGEISDLGRARALLAWDERTQMPPAGAEMRAEQVATLARIRHERLISDELGRLIDAAGAETESLPYESDAASIVRVARRWWEKARRVPAELRAEITRSSSLAEHAWVDARANSDFAAFLPHLRRNVELRRRYAACFGVRWIRARVRSAARRLRARHDDARDGGDPRRASRRPAPADPGDWPGRADRRRFLPTRKLSGRCTGDLRAGTRGRSSASGGGLAAGRHSASVRGRDLARGPSHHDPLRSVLHRGRGVVGDPRGRPRALRERRPARAVALASRQSVVPGLSRIPEPALGELGGAQPPLPGAPSAAPPTRSSPP